MILDKRTIRENYLTLIKDEWLAAPDTFPDFLTPIQLNTKAQNEQYILTVSDGFQALIKSFPARIKDRENWKKKLEGMLENVLCEETIIGVHDVMDRQTLAAFQDELKDFLRHVRAFAPELSMEGIGQAVRNYTVYMMFAQIHQVKQGFSPACFGYSMLYPFTDNYIDSQNYSVSDKAEYNHIIRDKIIGEEVHPQSQHQLKTCELLGMIESEYPRELDSTVYPRGSDAKVYMLLLMMLEAQEESIRQQSKEEALTLSDRLDISIYKGGISVLIDRFFVNREITDADLTFYLGFGFFLQLADDLQDIKEDSVKGHQTILTLDTSCVQEEKIVNKLLHFVQQITESYPAENDSFKNFVLSNCFQLIYSSIIGSKEYFSTEYLERMEGLFPVSYQFLEKMNRNRIDNKDIKIQKRYMKILDEMIR